MFFLLLAQAKESACKTLYQYTEDLGDAFAKHAASTLALVLPNLGPRNAVSVQVSAVVLTSCQVGAGGVVRYHASYQTMEKAAPFSFHLFTYFSYLILFLQI